MKVPGHEHGSLEPVESDAHPIMLLADVYAEQIGESLAKI